MKIRRIIVSHVNNTSLFRSFISISLILIIVSCHSTSDRITGATSLTDDIIGKYSREYKEDHGSYYDTIRDTIILLKKDQIIEVQNRKWFVSSDSPKNGFFRIPGLRTFQGKFNQTDTTIVNSKGGSYRLDIQHKTFYSVDRPNQIYTKVK